LQKLEKLDGEKTNIVVFSCHWNGAVFNGHAGNGLAMPEANIIYVNYLCAGRIEPGAALTAFQKGAQAILLTSCEKGSCHYQFGVNQAEENARKIKQLSYLLGIPPEHIQYHQIPSGNTERFLSTVREFATVVVKRSASEVAKAKGSEKD
jgi:coenzyme F420-reducing hydrogenase delta subunit